MLPPCPRCGKDNFKSSRDRNSHINRRIPCEEIKEPDLITESGNTNPAFE